MLHIADFYTTFEKSADFAHSLRLIFGKTFILLFRPRHLFGETLTLLFPQIPRAQLQPYVSLFVSLRTDEQSKHIHPLHFACTREATGRQITLYAHVMIVSRSASGVALRRILDVKTYVYNSQQNSKLLIWLGLDLVALATIRYNKDNNYV